MGSCDVLVMLTNSCWPDDEVTDAERFPSPSEAVRRSLLDVPPPDEGPTGGPVGGSSDVELASGEVSVKTPSALGTVAAELDRESIREEVVPDMVRERRSSPSLFEIERWLAEEDASD